MSALTSNYLEDPAFFADWFFNLPKHRRKTILFLFHCMKKYGCSDIWPSIETIARFSNCTERNVQKFFQKIRYFGQTGFCKFIKIIPRYTPNRDQQSNLYKFNDIFKSALFWLEKNGWLNAPDSKIQDIISSMKNSKDIILEFTRTQLKSSPNTDSSSYKEIKYNASLNQLFNSLNIAIHVKIYLINKFNESTIRRAAESLDRALSLNKVEKTPEAYIIAAAKKIASI